MSRILRSADVRGALRSRRRQRGFLIDPYRYASSDPFWSSVELLAHMEGGSPVDSSAHHTLTLFGNAALTSTRAIAGTQAMETVTPAAASSLRTGTTITIPNNTTSWTFECWVYPTTATGSYRHIMQLGRSGADRVNLGVAAGRLYLHAAADTPHSITSLPINTWTWVAMCFNNTSAGNWDSYFYQGPTKTSALSGGIFLATGASASFSIGTQQFTPGSNDEFLGSIDEVRITRVTRYAATTITVPSPPFPEH